VTVWLDFARAAQRVGKSERTIRNWISKGMPFREPGMVRLEDVLEFEKLMRSRRGRPRKPDPKAERETRYPEVARFVDSMYAELFANAHKGNQASWRAMNLREAWQEISWHGAKLAVAIKTQDEAAAREFAADVANGAMMLVDIINQRGMVDLCRCGVRVDEPNDSCAWHVERAASARPMDHPQSDARVITLCGSTKFKDEINAENARLTREGNLVVSLGMFGHVDYPDYDWSTDASDLKRTLDAIHFQKIRLADAVHVVNVGGYVGESTAREIEYARSLGKQVSFMVDRG
jgi:hypothetical protein